MPFTFEEICEKLKRVPEIDLLEILDVSSEEIVDRFRDLIEDRLEEFDIEFTEEADDFENEEE